MNWQQRYKKYIIFTGSQFRSISLGGTRRKRRSRSTRPSRWRRTSGKTKPPTICFVQNATGFQRHSV